MSNNFGFEITNFKMSRKITEKKTAFKVLDFLNNESRNVPKCNILSLRKKRDSSFSISIFNLYLY